jgi:hypothetical protein
MPFLCLLYLFACLLVIAGCGPNPEYPRPDQCLRAKLFQSCMAALPAGPVATKYNDWDEVVESCESAAYYQALRQRSQIADQCYSGSPQ